MTLTIIFLLSGVAVATLIFVKQLEEKNHRSFAVLELISKGDHRVRSLSHKAAHTYAEAKEKAELFIRKQLPMRTRNFLNKSKSYMEERIQKHMEDIRGSKLLRRKSDGISEFFKNLSEVEKGNGQIEEINFDNIEEVEQVAGTVK